MMHAQMRTTLVVSLAFILFHLAQTQPVPQNSTSNDEDIQWNKFNETGLESMMYGYLQVPFNHYNLTSKQTQKIYCWRHGPKNQSKGLIHYNFGGPGYGSSLITMLSEYLLPNNITSNYDLVACDLRGIGGSEPHLQDCIIPELNPLTDFENITVWEMAVKRVAFDGIFECYQNHRDIMLNMGTRQNALDLDILREKMGFEKMSLVGISYGTVLSTMYATLFPNRVERLVLDSTATPGRDVLVAYQDMAAMANRTFTRFINGCKKFPFGADDVGDGLTYDSCENKFSTVLLRSKKISYRAILPPSGLNSSQTAVVDLPRLAVIAALSNIATYSTDQSVGMKVMFDLMQNITKNDVLNLTLALENTKESGGSLWGLFGNVANRVVWGSDRNERLSSSRVQAKAADVGKETGLIGRMEFNAMIGPTVFTEIADNDLLLDPSNAQANPTLPVLILHGYEDPATPYKWAQQMHDQYPNGSLVSIESTFHGQAFTGRPDTLSAVDDIVAAYLESGTLPQSDTRCFKSNACF